MALPIFCDSIRIVLPLSTPALATCRLFMAVAYWNDWFLGVMLLDSPLYTAGGHHI